MRIDLGPRRRLACAVALFAASALPAAARPPRLDLPLLRQLPSSGSACSVLPQTAGSGARGPRSPLAAGALDALAAPRADCNGNGVEDAVDIALGFSSDLDGNGIPDECEARACIALGLGRRASAQSERILLRGAGSGAAGLRSPAPLSPIPHFEEQSG